MSLAPVLAYYGTHSLVKDTRVIALTQIPTSCASLTLVKHSHNMAPGHCPGDAIMKEVN